MNCTYCYDSGLTVAVIPNPPGSPGQWAICYCDAGTKIASRLALKSRPGLDTTVRAVAEIQAEAKRAGTDKLTDAEINAEIAARRAERKKTPADRLADAMALYFAQLPGGNKPEDDDADEAVMRAALDEYRSTRAAHPSFNEIVGNPPDPVMLARLTIDALTGGALSSLICQVHDNVVGGDRSTRPASTWAWKENLSSNLRALGEKLP
jgi:hypothetical protein